MVMRTPRWPCRAELNLYLLDRRDGYPPREQLPLPTEPPYTAHLGNMSFDTTEGEVSDFFKDCQVTKVRIVEDKMDRKPKGFGYVEFATLDGLKKALSYAGTSLAGRTIRVSVADPREPSSPYQVASAMFTNHMNSERQTRWTRFQRLVKKGPASRSARSTTKSLRPPKFSRSEFR
jgi:RNA recognition motif-containing protein